MPFVEPDLPLPIYEPKKAKALKKRTESFWNYHWIGFLFLLPGIAMCVVREFLGMSDAFLMAQTPWDRVSADYNLATIAAFFLGSLAFVIYALALPLIKCRGWRWVLPKLIFLACYWLIVIIITAHMSRLHS